MALRQHCLDELFANSRDAESLKAAFVSDKRVHAAFAMAVSTYEAMARNYDDQPGLCGPSPAQAALSTWLDVLDLRRDQDREQ